MIAMRIPSTTTCREHRDHHEHSDVNDQEDQEDEGVLTDKQMTRIKTGGDSLTRDSVPAKIFVKMPLKIQVCAQLHSFTVAHLILLGMTVR